MYRRILLSKDGTRLRESIEYGPPPFVGDTVSLVAHHRRIAGTVQTVTLVKNGQVTHEVKIVEL